MFTPTNLSQVMNIGVLNKRTHTHTDLFLFFKSHKITSLEKSEIPRKNLDNLKLHAIPADQTERAGRGGGGVCVVGGCN